MDALDRELLQARWALGSEHDLHADASALALEPPRGLRRSERGHVARGKRTVARRKLADRGGSTIERLVERDVLCEVGEQRGEVASGERGVDQGLELEHGRQRLHTGALRRATDERLERG